MHDPAPPRGTLHELTRLPMSSNVNQLITINKTLFNYISFVRLSSRIADLPTPQLKEYVSPDRKFSTYSLRLYFFSFLFPFLRKLNAIYAPET